MSIWQPRLAPELTRRDRISFYSATLCSLMLITFGMQVAWDSVLSLTCLLVSFSLAAYGLLSSVFESTRNDASANWETWTPLLIGLSLALLFIDLSLAGPGLLAAVVVMALLFILVVPFGPEQAILFSLPVFASVFYSAGNEADSSTLLRFALVGFYLVGFYRIWREQRPDSVLPDEKRITQLTQNLEESRSKSQALKAMLQKQERDFDREIADQTQYLREANTQLSQQIALRKTISDALVKSQTRLTQAIDASHLGLIDWDIAAGQFYQSAFHQQFGEKEQSSEQVIETLKRVIHPADYEEVRDTLNACLRGEQQAYDLQYRVKDDEDWCWIEECGKTLETGTDGRALRILGTRRNIQSEVLRDEQVRLAKAVFDHTSEGVFVLNPDGEFLSANPAYERIMGCKLKDLTGKSIKLLTDTPSREEVYSNILEQVRDKGSWQGELLEKKIHGDYFPKWMQINAILDEMGMPKYFAGMVADISDRKATDEKLDYLLNYDDLTKLANRVQFRDQLHRALLRFKDEQIPFVMVSLDLDRFKQFNDSFGYEAADLLLVEIAKRLSNSVQKVDILARIGGNEFAVIVACSPTFDVQKFAKRLFLSVTSAHYEIAGQDVMLSCSMGVARVPEDTQDIEALMRYAALAVQKAKYHGGNQIQLFDESLKSFSRRRLEMEHELRKALSNHELEVYYQPKLDLKQDRITSCEALIRWVHPTLGVISPEEFVNIAEENGLITDLGSFVLATACHQVEDWAQKGLGTLHVSVNLSARQLKDKGFQQVISSTLRESKISAECLELELTESMIMEDSESVVALLKDLRATGIKVSVDDFGTGYSSLSYLRELPVDTLKIDRAFIDDMENSKQQLAIVKAIVVLGESLGLQVVAEGVENEDQLQLLKNLGCDLIQGYLVSKPLNASEMEALLESQVVDV